MLAARSRTAFGLALFGIAAWPSAFGPAATPAAVAETRTVTLTLSATGKARWSSDGNGDRARLALSYAWHGTLKFSLHFPAVAATTLTGNWTGHLNGKTYRCAYRGRNVTRRATATLTNATRGRLQLVLHPRGAGFFPSKGSGATVACTSSVGARGPSHFEPEWLFRDSLQDHGRFSSNTAVILFPSAVLPRGAATVAFPSEVGLVDEPLRPKLTWNNRGRLTLRAR